MSKDSLISATVVSGLIIIVAFVVLTILSRACDVLAHRTNLERMEIRPFERILRGIVGLVALLLIFGSFGFPLDGLWTALTAILAMVAIGFVAVWSVLSNTLCTLIILIFRPFRIGDTISFPGEEVKGKVVDLTVIYTTLLSEEGELYQVPNNLFLQKSLRRKVGQDYSPSLAEQLRATSQNESH